jgi:hypothetical protein
MHRIYINFKEWLHRYPKGAIIEVQAGNLKWCEAPLTICLTGAGYGEVVISEDEISNLWVAIDSLPKESGTIFKCKAYRGEILDTVISHEDRTEFKRQIRYYLEN